MTHPTDAAIAQAFREARDMASEIMLFSDGYDFIESRARELDAAKGGEDERIRAMFANAKCLSCGHVGKFSAPHDCGGGQGQI